MERVAPVSIRKGISCPATFRFNFGSFSGESVSLVTNYYVRVTLMVFCPGLVIMGDDLEMVFVQSIPLVIGPDSDDVGVYISFSEGTVYSNVPIVHT